MKFFPHKRGFTLIEVLVSMVILIIILLVLVSVTNSTQKIWTRTTSEIEQFRGAREGFESITRRLSQATLNTYWDYERDSAGAPKRYIRQSELRFISGNSGTLEINDGGARPTHGIFFQAPLGFTDAYTGLENLLNTWGYFIEFGDDADSRPPFLSSTTPKKYRFRLMELMQPSESFSVYAKEAGQTSGAYTDKSWYTDAVKASGGTQVRVLANNVLALIILPKLTEADQKASSDHPQYDDSSLAPEYLYDSTGVGMSRTTTDKNLNPKNQLPPVVQVTLVAVDETSYARFQGTSTGMPGSLGLDGLFTSAESYKNDLATLENTLRANKLNYRIFTTAVSLKGAKWSREQKETASN